MSTKRPITGNRKRAGAPAIVAMFMCLALVFAGQEGIGFAVLHAGARPLIEDPSGPLGTILIALVTGTIGCVFSWPRRRPVGQRLAS